MEIVTSKYGSPNVNSGQHTNGPENVFVREDSSSSWYRVEDIRNQSAVRKKIEQVGLQAFFAIFCTKVD